MDTMILGKGIYYNLDMHKTKVNNNVLVVGASGAGKTRGIVIPNLLQASGSYIVSDPKGNLYGKYKNYLREKGYVVKKLDFIRPKESAHYNFFRYIHNTQDIVKISHMLIHSDDSNRKSRDPLWDELAQLLLQSIISLILEEKFYLVENFRDIVTILSGFNTMDDLSKSKVVMDYLIDSLRRKNSDSYAVNTYNMVRVSEDMTLRSILISLFSKIGKYATPELKKMMSRDNVNIPSIGRRRTALFVVVSDTDRSMDALANMFFTQAMNELCLYADKKCKDNSLPVPVRFILDDFATNCRITDFPRMIASIRSRNISTMLLVQAESQLEEGYGDDARTIIGNCDTYVYLGGNDINTAEAISKRCDVPLKKILYMPIGTSWIFRRGQQPVNGEIFELETMLRQKGIESESQRKQDVAV